MKRFILFAIIVFSFTACKEEKKLEVSSYLVQECVSDMNCKETQVGTAQDLYKLLVKVTQAMRPHLKMMLKNFVLDIEKHCMNKCCRIKREYKGLSLLAYRKKQHIEIVITDRRDNKLRKIFISLKRS